MKVSYDKDRAGLLRELQRAVEQYFERARRSPRADGPMVAKTAGLLALYAATYALLLFGHLPLCLDWALCVLVGFLWAGIGFCIMHDASHGAYSDRTWLNRLLAQSMNILGGNEYIWRTKHNLLHHSYTNVQGKDYDLNYAAWVRLSPFVPHRWMHRYQYLFAWPLYSLVSLAWVFFYDFFHLYKFATQQGKHHRLIDFANVACWKVIYLGYTLALPYLVLGLPAWQIGVGFLTSHLVFGSVLTVVFQLAHLVDEADHFSAGAHGVIPIDWVSAQLHATSNFAMGNRFLTGYLGGLNYQIEHHLFPKICSIHYPAISPIVSAFAREHGLPYRTHPSLASAVRSHFRFLQRMGDPASHLALAAAQPDPSTSLLG